MRGGNGRDGPGRGMSRTKGALDRRRRRPARTAQCSPTRGRASLRHRPRSSPTPLRSQRFRGAQPLSHTAGLSATQLAVCQPLNSRTRQTFKRHLWLHLALFRPPQLREYTPRDTRVRTPAHVSTTYSTYLAHTWRTTRCTWATVWPLRQHASVEAADAVTTAPFAHPVAAAPSSSLLRLLRPRSSGSYEAAAAASGY
jgi:hypothetical protein